MDAEKYKYTNLDFSATQLKNWDCWANSITEIYHSSNL
jgi:hypothetical protein